MSEVEPGQAQSASQAARLQVQQKGTAQPGPSQGTALTHLTSHGVKRHLETASKPTAKKESTVPCLASSQKSRDMQFWKCLCRKIVNRYVCEKINVITVINTQKVLLLSLIFASKMCQMAQILT